MALIPMVGAYVAFFIGTFLILLINPWQALAFCILFLVIQQLENNLIYPRVVGSSIGLPAMWVLSAVVIGGGLLGVLGMILFIPLTSVAYSLIRDWVKQREMMRLATQKAPRPPKWHTARKIRNLLSSRSEDQDPQMLEQDLQTNQDQDTAAGDFALLSEPGRNGCRSRHPGRIGPAS